MEQPAAPRSSTSHPLAKHSSQVSPLPSMDLGLVATVWALLGGRGSTGRGHMADLSDKVSPVPAGQVSRQLDQD